MDSGPAGDETTQTVGSTALADAGEGAQQAPLETTADTALIDVAPTTARPRNRLALLGMILAVPAWPVGLVLSALGLFNAVTRRTGKTMAVIGIALSVATGGAIVAVVADATSNVAASAALDPGCTGIEATLSAHLSTLKADTAVLQADEDDAASSNRAIGTVTADLSRLEADLTTAGAAATHGDVKSDLSTMNTQVQAVSDDLTGIQNHSTSSEGAAAAALTALARSDAKLDALCAAY